MGKYVIRRLLQMIPVIIGVTFIFYAAVFALGDPTVGRCGERACPPGYIAAFRKEYNLDQSLAVYEYRHTAQNGFIRTQLGCRGLPSLGLDRWHSIGGVRNPRDMHRETRFQAPAGTTLAGTRSCRRA